MAEETSKRNPCPAHWSLAQRLDRYTDKSGGPDACWPWIGSRDTAGYGQLWWEGKNRRVSRLAWVEMHGPIPGRLHVLHKCDNRPCRNEAHLFLGTHLDNMADRSAKGRTSRVGNNRGERNGGAKLTADDVRAIRKATGSQRAIAKRFGVTDMAVNRILLRKAWCHVPD